MAQNEFEVSVKNSLGAKLYLQFWGNEEDDCVEFKSQQFSAWTCTCLGTY